MNLRGKENICVIRNAKPQDWKVIQQLNQEVFEVSKRYDPYLKLNWPVSQEGVKYYKEVTKSEKYCCIIAEITGQSVGYLVGTERNYSYRLNRTGEIENMGVTPKHRGRGIGTKLVKEFKQWCHKRGITHIKVNTYPGYHKVINFYKKQELLPIDITLEGPVKN